MWELYLDYEVEIKMEEPFQIALEFTAHHPAKPPATGASTPKTTAKLVFIESAQRTDVFSVDYQLFGQNHPPTGGVAVNPVYHRQGWKQE